MSKSYGPVIASNPEKEPYVAVDAAGNLHIHVCGKCFTNNELTEFIHKDKLHLEDAQKIADLEEKLGELRHVQNIIRG